MQRLNDTTNDWFMEKLLLKAETSQDTPNWVLSNVQVMGQNAVTETLLNNSDGIAEFSFKTEKILNQNKNSIWFQKIKNQAACFKVGQKIVYSHHNMNF